MSYSTRPPESLTTPCWRPQAGAAARLPPVKMRKPMNCGIVCAASMSSAIALTMTGSSATNLPIVTDKDPQGNGAQEDLSPALCSPTLQLAGSLLQLSVT